MMNDRLFKSFIIATGFITQGIVYGIYWSFGVYYVLFLEAFNQPASITSWIGSVQFAAAAGSGPIASIVVNKFGCRAAVLIGSILAASGFALCSQANSIIIVILSFGVLSGVGLGFMVMGSVVSLSNIFKEKRHIAMGACSIGIGFGAIFFPQFIKYMGQHYKWSTTILATGIWMLVAGFFGFLLTTKPTEVKADKDATPAKPKEGQLALFKNIRFVLFCINGVTLMAGYIILSTFIVHQTIVMGMVATREEGSFVISTIGFASIFGRILMTVICIHPKIKHIAVYAVSMAMCGVLIAMIPMITDYTILLVVCGAYGFFNATYAVVYASVAVAIVGEEHVANALGLFTFIQAFGNLAAGPIGGFLYDLTHTYDLSFGLSSLLYCLSGLSLLYPWYCHEKSMAKFNISDQNSNKIDNEAQNKESYRFLTSSDTISYLNGGVENKGFVN